MACLAGCSLAERSALPRPPRAGPRRSGREETGKVAASDVAGCSLAERGACPRSWRAGPRWSGSGACNAGASEVTGTPEASDAALQAQPVRGALLAALPGPPRASYEMCVTSLAKKPVQRHGGRQPEAKQACVTCIALRRETMRSAAMLCGHMRPDLQAQRGLASACWQPSFGPCLPGWVAPPPALQAQAGLPQLPLQPPIDAPPPPAWPHRQSARQPQQPQPACQPHAAASCREHCSNWPSSEPERCADGPAASPGECSSAGQQARRAHEGGQHLKGSATASSIASPTRLGRSPACSLWASSCTEALRPRLQQLAALASCLGPDGGAEAAQRSGRCGACSRTACTHDVHQIRAATRAHMLQLLQQVQSREPVSKFIKQQARDRQRKGEQTSGPALGQAR